MQEVEGRKERSGGKWKEDIGSFVEEERYRNWKEGKKGKKEGRMEGKKEDIDSFVKEKKIQELEGRKKGKKEGRKWKKDTGCCCNGRKMREMEGKKNGKTWREVGERYGQFCNRRKIHMSKDV